MQKSGNRGLANDSEIGMTGVVHFTSYSTSTTTRTVLRSGVAASRSSTWNQPYEAFRSLPNVVCESRENCSAAIRAFLVAS